MLPVIPRERAHQDLEDILNYYDCQAGVGVATDFIREFSLAHTQVSKYPKIGSTRLCEKANPPNLRVWSLKKYPHQIFYRIETDRVDVWRVLHSRRNFTSVTLHKCNIAPS
jgi:toxin ParE1/3/4